MGSNEQRDVPRFSGGPLASGLNAIAKAAPRKVVGAGIDVRPMNGNLTLTQQKQRGRVPRTDLIRASIATETGSGVYTWTNETSTGPASGSATELASTTGVAVGSKVVLYRWGNTWYFVAPGAEASRDGCKVQLTATFDIPSGVITPVQWTAGNSQEVFDTGAYHNASNPERLTVPVGSAGLFLATARLEYPPNATDVRVAYLRHKDSGGTQLEVATQVNPNNGAAYSVAVPVDELFDMAEGDFVQVDGLQVSGSTLALFAQSTTLTLVKLGD